MNARPSSMIEPVHDAPRFEEVPHDSPHVCTVTVTEDHLSTMVRHVNNVMYLEFFSQLAESHAKAEGYDLVTHARSTGNAWYVLRHEIDYEREALLGDHLLLATWIDSMSRTTCRRDSIIFRRDDQGRMQACARCTSRWIYMNIERGRPTRIPDHISRSFKPIHVQASGSAAR